MLSLVSVLPDQTTADKAHCSWWMFFLSSEYWIILVCVLSDRSIEGKPGKCHIVWSTKMKII